jgi:hypothetical protein
MHRPGARLALHVGAPHVLTRFVLAAPHHLEQPNGQLELAAPRAAEGIAVERPLASSSLMFPGARGIGAAAQLQSR